MVQHYWKITWFDGANLREYHSPSHSIYGALSDAQARGCYEYNIFRIEKVAMAYD